MSENIYSDRFSGDVEVARKRWRLVVRLSRLYASRADAKRSRRRGKTSNLAARLEAAEMHEAICPGRCLRVGLPGERDLVGIGPKDARDRRDPQTRQRRILPGFLLQFGVDLLPPARGVPVEVRAYRLPSATLWVEAFHR